MPFCINTPLDMRDRVRDKVRDRVPDKVRRFMLQTPLPREYFPPSGFRVVSEWFWRVPNLSEDLSAGLSRAFGPSKLSGRLSGSLSGELSRRFCALKAVWRVVRGFVRGVVRGFKPVWTQNVKTCVYAEPPVSKAIYDSFGEKKTENHLPFLHGFRDPSGKRSLETASGLVPRAEK